MALLTRDRFRRHSSAQWALSNPVLLDGEPGWDSDVRGVKVGDGETPWLELDFLADGSITLLEDPSDPGFFGSTLLEDPSDPGTFLLGDGDDETSTLELATIGEALAGTNTTKAINPAGLAAAIEAAGSRFFYPEKYGAVGDGVTDDTDALLDMLDDAIPVSGYVWLSAKTYGFGQELQFLGQDRAVTVGGMGAERSILKALTPEARLSWGQAPVGPHPDSGMDVWGRPGLNSNFKFDGNLIATRGIFVGPMVAYATYQNIVSTRCNGDGFTAASQNTSFISCLSEDHAANAWTIDYGAQVLTFKNCHGLSSDGWQWEVRQSGGPGWGQSAQSQSILFLGGISEAGGAPSFTDTYLGGFKVTEGIDIVWERFEFSVDPNDEEARDLVLTPSTANGYVGRNVLRDFRALGSIYIDANDEDDVAQPMGGTQDPLYLEGRNVLVGSIYNGSTAPVYDNSLGNTFHGGQATYVPVGDGAYPQLAYGVGRDRSDAVQFPVGAWTIDASFRKVNYINLTGAGEVTSLEITNPEPGAELTIIVVRDGAQTMTWADNMRFDGNVAPTTPSPGTYLTISFIYEVYQQTWLETSRTYVSST